MSVTLLSMAGAKTCDPRIWRELIRRRRECAVPRLTGSQGTHVFCLKWKKVPLMDAPLRGRFGLEVPARVLVPGESTMLL